MQNLTSGFDPLVFNGILPTSTDTLLMTDMPVSSQYMYNPNFSEPKDTFTPSEPNNGHLELYVWLSVLLLSKKWDLIR